MIATFKIGFSSNYKQAENYLHKTLVRQSTFIYLAQVAAVRIYFTLI